tara:strand:+ start:331 stop:522 length:192 start_codon:yes stop_codon:yes gene_type:complete
MITLQVNKNSDDYAKKRNMGYWHVGEQLDILYHDITAGKLGEAAKTSNFYLHRKSIKDKYPKP